MGHSDGVNIKLSDHPVAVAQLPDAAQPRFIVLLCDILFAALVTLAVWQIMVYCDHVRWREATATMCQCHSNSPRGDPGPPGLTGPPPRHIHNGLEQHLGVQGMIHDVDRALKQL
jgi:hypothetical protein